MSPAAHVLSLHRYPVKSCRGMAMGESHVERRGFPLDRRFMVVDEHGTFRSQRKHPRLARVEVTVDGPRLTVSAAGAGCGSIDVDEAADGAPRRASVWRHRGTYLDQGDEVAAFFTQLLGEPSRVVHMPDSATRRPNRAFGTSAQDLVSFADGYPLLLTTTGSLAALQEAMDEPVPMDRFRPNIVLECDEPWAEDGWRELRIGDVDLHVAKACTRCVITTTDQRSGERFREPMRTLAQTRRTRSGVTFGVYLIPRTLGATIRVGDPVTAR